MSGNKKPACRRGFFGAFLQKSCVVLQPAVNHSNRSWCVEDRLRQFIVEMGRSGLLPVQGCKQEELGMKLSTRLGLIVGCAALGALILVFISFQTIRSSMLEGRQDQIRSMVNLAAKQVDVSMWRWQRLER